MAKEEQIKTSIDLTGEKEYRAACTNINSSLREIGSEMKLTTAEFADNADSVEALTAKQKLLQKQFDEQAKKAEAAKALAKARIMLVPLAAHPLEGRDTDGVYRIKPQKAA